MFIKNKKSRIYAAPTVKGLNQTPLFSLACYGSDSRVSYFIMYRDFSYHNM